MISVNGRPYQEIRGTDVENMLLLLHTPTSMPRYDKHVDKFSCTVSGPCEFDHWSGEFPPVTSEPLSQEAPLPSNAMSEHTNTSAIKCLLCWWD